MSHLKFKLTSVAALVLSATSANAALYQIIEVEPVGVSLTDTTEVYGEAIQPVSNLETVDELGSLGCFDTSADAGVCESYLVAGDTRDGIEGVSFREEVAFSLDNSFYYIQTDDGDDYFESYCYRYLGYSTCEDSWAPEQWSGFSLERNDETVAQAFIEGDDNAFDNSYNTVINSLTVEGKAAGNMRTGASSQSDFQDNRNEAFSPVPLPEQLPDDYDYQSRAWFTDGTFTVGSVSKKYTNDNGNSYLSKAAIWSETDIHTFDWTASREKDGDQLSQSSLRSLKQKNEKIYAVGYDTYYADSNLNMNASIFVSDSTELDGAVWSTLPINGVQIDSDRIYANSVATDINSNLVVLGQAKHYNDRNPENGAYPDKIFVADYTGNNSSSDTWSSVKFLNSMGQSIFFNGAGGKAGAINNFNEIVGQIDSQQNREENGKQRRRRGFIYPYDPVVSDRADIFQNKAWLLDDLTNGGEYSDANNHYRIYDATDINDAGVISATALKCTNSSGESLSYDSTDHNSYCNGGVGNTEKLVAVKLVPIPQADSSSDEGIVPRDYINESAERQGAGLGWLALTFLGWISFRRK
ncbi:hypothetical protein BCU68_00170 [Vibrio sp. 10N.286.49.B3]|uniref:DUF3466 family protein n=1 Tax=Vibrio sp. 10N.286.49.B3 TaxID=1880855 RepID=UPI000C84EBB7|nr:DUF3466 family protein [Vibrio sp. 10N.286.49.B3]PMH46504.1 hypothetical protein BCU68_00170 [Vibrio sp. 10N.286.49.B3]